MSGRGVSVSTIALGLLGLLSPALSDASWYDPSWHHRKTITLNGALVPAPQTNFPVLVSLSADADLAANALDTGDDILFTADNGITKLDHEIESFDGIATGALIAWVRVPSLASGTNTTIYMYYGNTGASNQENVAGVWDSGFQGVWHLNENPDDPAPQFPDVTSNPNDGTANALSVVNQVPGRIGGSLEFDDTNERHVNVPDHPSLQLATNMTVSSWVRTTDSDAFAAVIVNRWLDGGNKNYWLGKLDGSNMAFQVDNDTYLASASLGLVNDDAWHHVVGVADASLGELRIYVDGIERGNDLTYSGVSETGSSPLQIGKSTDVITQTWLGRIDEVRVSNTVRSASWLLTEYNNGANQGVGVGRFILSLGAQTTPVYYSVGTSGITNLRSSPALTADITAGTITFSEPQAANIGVGDEITYNTSFKAYISGRTSATVYAVTDEMGGTPGDVTSAAVDAINRAFPSLSAAQTGSWDGNHLGTQDLVTGGFQLNWPCYNDATPMNGTVDLMNWTTGADHYIRIYTPVGPAAVGTSQRHTGRAGTGFRLAPVNATVQAYTIVFVRTEFVRIEGLEIDGTGLTNATTVRAVRILDGLSNVGDFRLDSSIIHDLHSTQGSVNFDATHAVYDFQSGPGIGPPLLLTNNIVYDITSSVTQPNHHIGGFYISSRTTSRVFNNTIYRIRNNGGAAESGGGAAWGIYSTAWPDFTGVTVIAKNNFVGDVDAVGDPTDEAFRAANGGILTQNNNVSSDDTAGGAGSRTFEASYGTYFQNTADTLENLHLTADSMTLWTTTGEDLSSTFTHDVDAALRATPWDIGADDVQATTAVDLVAFDAVGDDGAVVLTWETGSEIDNLGFHLYRSESEKGSFERITEALIPGLGDSPVGARYAYRDRGLANGTTYYYELEAVETTGLGDIHGPVSATPLPGGDDPADPDPDPDGSQPARITYGDPSANTMQVLRRGRYDLLVRLSTTGFYAVPQDDGSVRVEIPGFDIVAEEGAPSIPVKRTWLDALAGRDVTIASVREQYETVTGVWPIAFEASEIVAGPNGAVRPVRSTRAGRLNAVDAYPKDAAHLVTVGFQGDAKKALLQMAPLRWDEARSRLLLSRELEVRVSLARLVPDEYTADGIRGRRRPAGAHRRRASQNLLARFATHERGLYAVRFDEVFGARRRALRSGSLRLSRQGVSVPYHIEPATGEFRRGSVLYFVSPGAAVNPHGNEAVFELHVSESEAVRTMTRVAAAPWGPDTSHYWHSSEQEQNRFYQPALTGAPDLWLWDLLLAPSTKSFPFELTALVATGERSHLEIWLQGTSDSPEDPDHHVRIHVNGALVGEDHWNGKADRHLTFELAHGLLREGENQLEIENVGDTEAPYSLVMLNRFRVRYPRRLVAERGKLEGAWNESGTATISGLGGSAFVVDVTEPTDPRWLEPVGSSFRAEASRSYLVVGAASVSSPEVRVPSRGSLKNSRHRADYVVIGPRAFLEASSPLLRHREGQGLVTAAVAIEDVFSEFGHGEPSPEAVHRFIAYAYHEWQPPSVRYVLLLGNASYDAKDFLGTGVENHVPTPMVKTAHLWTASDPMLAAVNGDDHLPDVAIGRLSVDSVVDVRRAVEKILAWESVDRFAGRAVLVADDSDGAGDFVANAEAAAGRLPETVDVHKIYLSELGREATRNAVTESFDRGASLVSYVGHGGIHLWADENIFQSTQVDSLSPQSQLPIVVTMNCLNGYFHFPYFDSLAEALVGAADKGAIAAISPSGLSLDAPAQELHLALLDALYSGEHVRLGDALLDAQENYLETGVFPELLSIYHVLGDPALKLR